MTDVSAFRALTVAVLLGGRSSEREVSLRSGKGVLGALERLGLRAIGVDPGPDLVSQLTEVGADVVFNVLHGGPGENGAVQGILDNAGIPYAGSGVLASALAMNKEQTKRVLRAVGLPTPDWLVFKAGDDPDKAAQQVATTLGLPAVVKPVDQGSSVGVAIVDTRDALAQHLASTLETYARALVEKFVDGREVTVGLLGFGSTLRALPVLELVPRNRFYDYEAKYTKGMTELLCPAPIGEEATRRCQEVALAVHQAIGCHGWSRVDMHLDSAGQVWVHEINSIPGMTETSDVPAEAAAAGMTYDELVAEILCSALPRMAAARPEEPLPAM
ncbi:MAG: D-alanine--D-alanine ligase [Armatimonadetes bacterium]|nr:D-alanine--D-alanine ligase [Armatimonadota bacterium]